MSGPPEPPQPASPPPAPPEPPLPEKVPLTARLLLRESLSARAAAGIIAGFTVAIAVGGAFLERTLDHRDFHTLGRSLWFSLETVTTVGYGDVTPQHTAGRIVAGLIMLTGLGFLAVITASVTASLVEGSRRRFAAQQDDDVARRLAEMNERLARLEAALARSAPPADDE